MPIPNDKFVPGVVCNHLQVIQIAEWIADRPVPTLEELGQRPPEPSLTLRVRAHYDSAAMTTPQTRVAVRVGPKITPRVMVPGKVVAPKRKV